MIDNTTLYGIVTIAAAVIGVCIRYAFRSKCTEVKCCFGLINIKRDIEKEVETTEIEAHVNGATPTNLQRDRSDSMRNITSV